MHRLHDGMTDIGFTGWFIDHPSGAFTIGYKRELGNVSVGKAAVVVGPVRSTLVGWVWNDLNDPSGTITRAGDGEFDVAFSALIQGF